MKWSTSLQTPQGISNTSQTKIKQSLSYILHGSANSYNNQIKQIILIKKRTGLDPDPTEQGSFCYQFIKMEFTKNSIY